MEATLGSVLFVVIVVLAFYLILLRPVVQQQRRQRLDIANLQIGDEVLTQAGFIAKVKDIRVPQDGPSEIILDLGGGVEVRAVASAISQRLVPRAGPRVGETEALKPAAKQKGQDPRKPRVGSPVGRRGRVEN